MEVICNIKKELIKLHRHFRERYPSDPRWHEKTIWSDRDNVFHELEDLIANKVGWKDFYRKSWFKPNCGEEKVHVFHTDGWQHLNANKMLIVAHPKPTQFLICNQKFDRSYYLPDTKLADILNNGGIIKEFKVGDVVLANITDLHRSNPRSQKRVKRLLLRVLR